MSEENKVIAANEPERAEGSNFIDISSPRTWPPAASTRA